jgi:sugar phosphate permease
MMRSRITVAAALFLITGAVNLQIPLYQTYAAAAGFGNGPTALAFAAYVAGLLPVLIFLGGSSDRLGRKPILLAGLGCAALATAAMIAQPTIAVLFVARLLQGVGVGLGVGAGTAYLAELLPGATGPARAAALVAVTTSLGFGGGALLTTAVLALQGAQPLIPVSYPLHLLAAIACFAVALGLPSLPARGGALVRPPHFPPGTIPIGLSIAVAWSVTGIVIAIVPAQLARFGLGAWAGLALFLVNGTGALCQPLARRLTASRALGHGYSLLSLGYLLLLLGAWRGLLPLVLLGAAIAGSACYGFTYLGGLAAIAQTAAADRARAVSGYFLCAYLGFGLPSIALGFLADRTGVSAALAAFGAVVLAANAALRSWGRWERRQAVAPLAAAQPVE